MDRALKAACLGHEITQLYTTLAIKSSWFKGLTGVSKGGVEAYAVAMDIFPKLSQKSAPKTEMEEKEEAAMEASRQDPNPNPNPNLRPPSRPADKQRVSNPARKKPTVQLWWHNEPTNMKSSSRSRKQL